MTPPPPQQDSPTNPVAPTPPATRAAVRLGIAPPPKPPQSTDDNNMQERRQDPPQSTTSQARPSSDLPEADDPDPLPPSSTQSEATAHRRRTKEYTQEMFNTYKSTTMNGKDLWEDFITAFRDHTIRSWQRPMVTAYWDLLKARGVHVEGGRGKNKKEELINLLSRQTHIQVGDEFIESADLQGERPASGLHDVRRSPMQPQEEAKRDTEESTTPQPPKFIRYQEDDGGRGPNDSSSSDSEDHGDRGWKASSSPHAKKGDDQKGAHATASDNHIGNQDHQYFPKSSGLGVQGLMKAYVGQTQFSGAWDEDLDTAIGIFETLSDMCELDVFEMRQALPVMLKGDALSLYSERGKGCKTYDETIQVLRGWYNSPDKQTRILSAWQDMSLLDWMGKDGSSSEVDVFRKFTAKLMSLQKQLDGSYHSDQYLRDRLLSAVDIPEIRISLRDRIPRTSAQAINRVANRLSDKPRTAGVHAAEYDAWKGDNSNKARDRDRQSFTPRDRKRGYRPFGTARYASAHACEEYEPTGDTEEWTEGENEAMYTLGRSYGGEARRTVRQPWKPSSNRYRSNDHRGRDGGRLNSKWLKGIQGCFVCGKHHLANDKHPRHEVTAAIKRLKANHPSALLTVADLDNIQSMQNVGGQEDREEEDAEVQWAEEDELDEYNESFYIELEGRLSNSTFDHGRTTTAYQTELAQDSNVFLIEHNTVEFEGIRIDTCANRASVISKDQYLAYCKEFGVRPNIRPSEGRAVHGIGGTRDAIGTVTIQIPFVQLRIIIDVHFLVISGRLPTLLSMKDMLDNDLDISLQGSYIAHKDRRQALTLDNYFLIHRWRTTDTPFCLYTEAELRRIHRNFGHPSIKSTTGLLKRATETGKLDAGIKGSLKRIEEACDTCKEYAGRPRRFKLTIGTDALRFNHTVEIDTMFINNKPVLHMIDLATHFCAAAFLKEQSTDAIWKKIQSLWCLVYMGPPDHLSVDQGTAYTSREMRAKCESVGIKLIEAPIENPGSIGTVERYHSPLRASYLKIRAELDRGTTNDECLQMAVHAVNCTIGPEGLCPVLLVFGAIPRPARSMPSPTQIERAEAMEKAMKAVQKEQAKKRIAFGKRSIGSPKGKERSEALHRLPAGSEVLVYRTVTKGWEGPFIFVSIDGETAVIQTAAGRKLFRSTCVIPYQKPIFQHARITDTSKPEALSTEAKTEGEVSIGKDTRPEKTRRKIYESTRKDELRGLLTNGTFKPVDRDTLTPGTRVFGSRFIDELKRSEQGLRRKSRLVAQNYGDLEASNLATKAPTVQRFSQRIAMAIAASIRGGRAFTRDITQAYIQSETALEREVYIAAPKELGLEENIVLRVKKPLYGIPESGLHWYLTYLEHHVGRLGMERTRADPCVLYERSEGELKGLVILQVDDSFGAGTPAFLDKEDTTGQHFLGKPRQILTDAITNFNGTRLQKLQNGVIHTDQKDKCESLRHPATQKEFASERAKVQYIGVMTRPDVCASTQLIAPGSDKTTPAEFKTLIKTIDLLHQTPDTGINFVPLNLQTVRIILMSDASFANARDAKSQLGFLILLADDERNANIVHYASRRCRRVTRSIMAAELHALIEGFDAAFVVKDMMEELLGQDVKIDAYIDSKTVFDIVAKQGSTTERRLLIDVCALKESYAKGELENIAWIPGETNASDALTKQTISQNSPLVRLMQTNVTNLSPIGWASIRRSGQTRHNAHGTTTECEKDNNAHGTTNECEEDNNAQS